MEFNVYTFTHEQIAIWICLIVLIICAVGFLCLMAGYIHGKDKALEVYTAVIEARNREDNLRVPNTRRNDRHPKIDEVV